MCTWHSEIMEPMPNNRNAKQLQCSLTSIIFKRQFCAYFPYAIIVAEQRACSALPQVLAGGQQCTGRQCMIGRVRCFVLTQLLLKQPPGGKAEGRACLRRPCVGDGVRRPHQRNRLSVPAG